MIDLVKKYLDINQYSNQKADFEDLFLSHPNYPSLFAITDSLNTLSIENIAINVSKEQLPELPDSFLAMYNIDLVLVTKTNTSISIETEKGIKKGISFNEFLTHWNGIVLAVEPNVNSIIENNYNSKKWFSYTLCSVLLVALSSVFNVYSWSSTLTLITSAFGLIVSIFIVQEKLGIKNEMASKFCNINPNNSCDAVIRSDKASNKKIHFSDLPLLFFGTSTFSILIEPNQSSLMIGFLSLLSLPVIAYSIWIQKFQIKKWCVLCLTVSFAIVFQALITGFLQPNFQNVASINVSVFVFSLMLLTSIWLFLKPVLEKDIKFEKEMVESKKFKRNYALFSFLSKEIPSISGFHELEGLHFGSKEGEIQLSIILSPSCGHCHKAFKEAFELVTKFPERISLKVLFNINPENNDNPYKAVVETLLVINNEYPNKALEAIADWHIKKMELEEWKNKWKVNILDTRANLQMLQQYNWCLQNEFNYTPVKIVNNTLFPAAYEISELKYFLNDFAQEKENNTTKVVAQA